jgi:signal transduction histidine kinase/CheY-like chemotaxis protein
LSVSVSVLPLLSAIRFSPGRTLVVGLIYFGAARYGWILAAAPTGVSPFWPPAGIALALLILWGRHVWPGILLGALAADLSLGLTSRSILVGAIANTIEPLAAATLLARWPGFDSRLERPRDLTALLLSAGLAALLGSLIGMTGLWLVGISHPKSIAAFVIRMSTWWLGDAMGVLVLSPPLLIWGRTPLSWPTLPAPSALTSARWRRRGEAFLLVAALGLTSYLSFGPATPAPSVHSAVEYLPFPLIIWASMRFGVRGASAASLVLTASAVWHYSISPLERHQLGADANLLLLQTSIAVIVLTALVIGAVMTERDAVTRALDESRAKLQQKQHLESLGLLAGGVAHDFNNLLTGVLGSASLARQQMPARLPAAVHLKEIENAAERAANLCRQMLAYAGQGRFQSQPLDLSAVVRDEIGALSRTMGTHISVTSELPGHLPAVDADATQLRQVVTNLLLNASEAIKGDAGSIRIATGMIVADRAHLATAHLAPELDAGRYVSLTIVDSGHGMSTDTLPRIFDPFFTTKFTGRGLGLAAVLGIVRSHRGALWVTSAPGAGTTFRVLLPATDAPAILPAAAAVRPAVHVAVQVTLPPAVVPLPVPDTPRRRNITVGLIVDDEASVRAVATRMLAACGLAALTASSGEEAVAVLEAHPGGISLVLLDLTMPAMNGEETYRRMRAIDRSVPVLLMSGYSEQEASAQFGGQGTSGFIQKPFRLDELKEAIRRVLRDDAVLP